MKPEELYNALNEVLAANKRGEVKNLLITDDNPAFLEDALLTLRRWTADWEFNLVELDEREAGWLSEIQTRELFDKLNQPNTVLLIQNYATVGWDTLTDNNPRNFLYDLVRNRHYGCGNDFVPSDDLPNLLFVVATSNLEKIRWKDHERQYFEIIPI